MNSASKRKLAEFAFASDMEPILEAVDRQQNEAAEDGGSFATSPSSPMQLPQPIVRATFPLLIKSPVLPKVLSTTALRTCFRIGELLQVARSSTSCFLVEVYARMYDGVLYDLFHSRPPFIPVKIFHPTEDLQDPLVRVVGLPKISKGRVHVQSLRIQNTTWDTIMLVASAYE